MVTKIKIIGIKLSLFVFVLFSFTTIYALSHVKGDFSGTIKDKKTGMPIEGASVYLADIKAGSSTNKDGLFKISNIADGKHLVEISHINYATIIVEIEFKGSVQKDFFLEETILENNAVIITGVSKASQLKTVPFQVSVMRQQDLLQTSCMNIIESITKKSGVSSLSTGPAISKPLIRGLGYNRVLTINDGVRQEGQQWGDEHGIEIDEASVQKIEVLKGPASLVYGSDAMAGVINIISNVPAPNNTIKINVGTNYQTNNRLRNFNANISGNKNGFNWSMYGTKKASGDYKNKYDGYVFNSKFNEQNFGGYLGYNGGWGFSHLLFSKFDLTAGLVEGDRDSLGNFIKVLPGGIEASPNQNDFLNTNPYMPYQHIRHIKLATDNNIKLGNNHLTLNIGLQQNQREEFGNPDDVNERALFFDLKTLTYASQFHFKERNGWKNSIGINGMNQQNTNKGIEQLIPDYRLLDMGIFVFSQKEFHKINFSGGIRFDNRHINTSPLIRDGEKIGDAFQKSFSNVSGSIGLAYPITSKVNLKLNLARAFRAPSISELSSNGAHEGTLRFEYGDKNLNSEISTQSDFAIEYNEDHFSFNLAGYYNHFNNFIFYRKLQNNVGNDSLIEVDGDMLQAFKFDQQKVNLAGIEFTLDLHPHPLDWLHIENTFSYVSGVFKNTIEGSKNLPFIPAPKLLTEFRADFKKINTHFRNNYIKLEIDNTFKQSNPFTAYNTETATNGYTLINAGLGSEIFSKKNNKLFAFYFTASNLGDVAYQNHLSRLKYAPTNLATGRNGVFNVGRNFGLKIMVPLIFKI
jgi:iron complex outermembrane receptor protein